MNTLLFLSSHRCTVSCTDEGSLLQLIKKNDSIINRSLNSELTHQLENWKNPELIWPLLQRFLTFSSHNNISSSLILDASLGLPKKALASDTEQVSPGSQPNEGKTKRLSTKRH